MKKILPENINDNIFKLIGKDWMLVAAQKDGKVNAMTASWGFGGVMWGKNAVVVGIRPQRYTKEFVDNGDTFSITILPESYRETMSYFGTVSGRDEDKIAKTGLTVAHDENTPYFEEGRLVLICKKMYSQEIKEENFIDKSIIDRWYPNKDYHMMYVAEIFDVLEN